MTGLAEHTEVEAVDGPTPVRELVGKGMPVLTRLPSGTRGFRILSKVTPSPTVEPVVRIRLDNGRSAIMTMEQIVFRTGAVPVKVGALQAGDVLEASFHYPPGYRLRDSDAKAGPPHDPGVRVLAVEPAGTEIVYSGRVKETGCLFLSAGILCAL